MAFFVHFSIANDRKFLGHRPVDPCLFCRVSQGHPVGVPGVFLSLCALFFPDFRKKFRKHSGKTEETLSERFLEFPSRVRLGSPKPYNSKHLRLPEHFQNFLPPSTAGDASFFRSGSGEGLMQFPAVLGLSLSKACWLLVLARR